MKKFGKGSRVMARARRDCQKRQVRKGAQNLRRLAISSAQEVNPTDLTREIGQMTVERASRIVCPGRVLVGTIQGVVCFAYRITGSFAKIAARASDGDLYHWVEIPIRDFFDNLDNHQGTERVATFLRHIASRTKDEQVDGSHLLYPHEVHQRFGVPDWNSLISLVKPFQLTD